VQPPPVWILLLPSSQNAVRFANVFCTKKKMQENVLRLIIVNSVFVFIIVLKEYQMYTSMCTSNLEITLPRYITYWLQNQKQYL